VSVFFYLRVVVMMYMAERDGTLAVPVRISRVAMVTLAVTIFAIFYLGILPTPVLDLAAESIATIF